MQEFNASQFMPASYRDGGTIRGPTKNLFSKYEQQGSKQNFLPEKLSPALTEGRPEFASLSYGPSNEQYFGGQVANWSGDKDQYKGQPNGSIFLVSCLGPVADSSETSQNNHNDLLRTDSGNSSLSTTDSLSDSTSTGSRGSSFISTSLDHNFSEDASGLEEEEEPIRVNVYVPETQCEYDIACSRRQSIWQLKTILIERNADLRENGLNYGIFCFPLGHFLDEQLTFADYFVSGKSNGTRFRSGTIRLEFLYKQRIKYGEVMSTLPIASATRKKRKRSRLLSAIQNGNLEKVVKALANCDPNFVDEATGETPLSLAAASQLSNSGALQQIIAAIVNGGGLLDFRTKDGRSALHVAVQKSNFVTLKTLLDLGGSANLVDSNGLSPLYYSIIHKANSKLTQLLLHEHATLGVTDQHGWQEVHHASKLGLVSHLEQLLFYGCDMNCRIVGSGNTPLHVAAINDQGECARILLLRGCDTTVVNNSHQNAYQVAVISGNMALSEMIQNHKLENVVPYRDKPRYNPARRPPNHYGGDTLGRGGKSAAMNGASDSSLLVPRPSSPSVSLNTNNTTASSGVCCDVDEDAARKKAQQSGEQQENLDEYEDEEEEDEEDDEKYTGENSSDSEDSATFLPGMTVKAVSDYNSGDPSHLQLRRNDHVLLLQSTHSPPTIASQKLLLGRRCADSQEGFFPACCVEKIKRHHSQNGDENGHLERVEGRRDMKLKSVQSATLPTRGRRGARKCLLDKGVTRQYQERTVILNRGSKGFGFVLRGAKDSSPILNRQLMQQGVSMPLIGLQYFDEIESSGIADIAGIKRGDFLLAVNNVDVRHMSHENVVQQIRQSGDKVTMTIATFVPKQLVSILKKKGRSNKAAKSAASQASNGGPTEMLSSSQSQTQMSQSAYASLKAGIASKAPPPAPPKRDPSTTLSTSRARARSLVVPSEVRSAHHQTIVLMGEAGGSEIGQSQHKRETEDEVKCSSPSSVESMARVYGTSPACPKGSKVASIRTHSSRRISSYELNDFMSRQSEDNAKTAKTNGFSTNDSAAGANLTPRQVAKSDSLDSSSSFPAPPQSAYQTSIVKVTLAKPQQPEFSGQEATGGADTSRALSSFQAQVRPSQELDGTKTDAVPAIPEPDYSSDEEENKAAKSESKSVTSKEETAVECKSASSDASGQAVKLTTTATVVLKSSSPCPPTEGSVTESTKNFGFSSKNMFDELREQSAKITNSARLRFASNRQSSQDGDSRGMRRMNSQEETVSNVMKNVAEFEKRLGKDQIAGRVASNGTADASATANAQMRMSKSCMEEFVPIPSGILKKGDYATLTRATLRHQQQQQQQDSRRNSAIISAIAEKVAAVNQLVAEQQSGVSGSKSLNNSPIPSSMGKLPGQPISGSTVLVQKPIAMMPSGSTAAASSTLTRRCVTVCDPVKTIHLQQQQQQLRSQLSHPSTAQQLVKSKHASLAESTSSILKQASKSRSTTPANYGSSSPTIDLVPPPPEFAAAAPSGQATGQSQQSSHLRHHSLTPQQKIYLQRQMQLQSTSPLTVATGGSQGTPGAHHHHHHHQLVSEVPQQHYQQPAQTGQSHCHMHHQGPTPIVSLSSSAPTSDALALMRSSLMGSAASQMPLSNYEYATQMVSQGKANQAHHGGQAHIYGQQQISGQHQQQQAASQQQNQLLVARALAAANAKFQQQQQQQQVVRPNSSMAYYNTLATSKPMAVQQYYVTQQQQQHQPSQQSQHPQSHLATLSRHQQAAQQQQYLNSISSHQQQLHQQQFATLTRHQQQQFQQQLQPALQQGQLNYAHLVQRQQQQQPMSNMAMPGTRLVQVAANRQTPPPAGSGKGALNHAYHVSQQQQQQQYSSAPASNTVASYARKSLVEWNESHVQEWLQRIGMAEHRPKFECFNGAKMLRLNNNELATIGVRQPQHRIYILEKLKQQIFEQSSKAVN